MVQFDAESIKNRLIDRLRAKASWSDILFFSTNQRIIEIFAEELAYDMQYDEMLTIEGKWNIAQQVSSLLSENQFFNYYPHRKVGSSGNLRVSTSPTFNQSYALNIALPKYAIVSNNTLNFSLSETTSLLSNELYKDIPIVQGIPKEFTFTALGSVYEEFIINNNSIENSIFDVYVNNELWSYITNIREAINGYAKVYVLENLNDFSGIKLIFGNDYFGKKLTVGDKIVFKCLETAGLSGNVDSSNIISTFETTVYDTNGNSVDLYCTNLDAITGGLDYEDKEEIRANAPRAYKSGDTAITKGDYQYIMESFSFIKKANVWGETEVNEDLGNEPGTFIDAQENLVNISLISASDTKINAAQETAIRNYINEKKSPTDILQFYDPNFIYINFIVQAFVIDKKYTLTFVSDGIINTLSNVYSVNSLDFKTDIYQSEYIAVINGVEGVGYHNTVLSFYKFEYFSTAYTADINIYMEDITPGSLKIYIKNDTLAETYSLMAQDNSSGTIVGVGAYTLAASTIDYNTGVGAIAVTAGLTGPHSNYSLKVVFNVDTTNVLPTQRNHFVSYGTSTISLAYT